MSKFINPFTDVGFLNMQRLVFQSGLAQNSGSMEYRE